MSETTFQIADPYRFEVTLVPEGVPFRCGKCEEDHIAYATLLDRATSRSFGCETLPQALEIVDDILAMEVS